MNNKQHHTGSFLAPLTDKAMDNLMNLSRECKTHPRVTIWMSSNSITFSKNMKTL